MRKDTQIGVILGVVILGIIAIFLSIRTSVDKQIDKKLSGSSSGLDSSVTKNSLDIYEDDTFIENTLDSDIEDIADIVTTGKVEDVVDVRWSEIAFTFPLGR